MSRLRVSALALALSLGIGLGSGGPAAEAGSRAVLKGAGALAPLKQGSNLAALEHRRVGAALRRKRAALAGERSRGTPATARHRDRQRARTLDRALLASIDLAPRNPERAARLLAEARAYAVRHGLALDPAVVDALAAATAPGTAPFARAIPDAELAALARPPQMPLAALIAYARTYGAMMRRYNGPRPGEVVETLVKQGRWGLTADKGRVSYWDIDPRSAEATILGVAEASPFRTPAGKVRVFNHFLDRSRQADLLARFGEPTGSMEAEMTSSYRTLLIYPDGAAPYMLKFSGDFITSTKDLTPTQVATSVERSLALRDDATLVPEPAGLVLDGKGRGKPVTVLFRPLPGPRGKTIAPGSSLLSAHVLNSTGFATTELGARTFARWGSQAAWMEQELAPKLARLVHRSITKRFVHLELHSQNIDVLVDRNGNVTDIFVKDLLDMVHDPALEAASGSTPEATALLRDREWGDIGDANATYTVERFHKTYLGQTAFPAGTYYTSPLHQAVLREIQTLARADAGLMSGGGASLDGVFAPTATLASALGALREASVKAGIERSFRADPRAQARLGNDAGRPIRGRPNGPSPGSTRTVGFVGKVPVEVWRDPQGRIDDYLFRFE